MKKIKITNVSGVKLEFFIRFEDSDDKLVSLDPGVSCFSHGTTLTKSMRIFDRKGLLKIDKGEYIITEDFSNAFIVDVSKTTPSIIPNATPDNDEVLDNLHTTKSISIENTGSLEGDLLKFHNIGKEEFEQIKKEITETFVDELNKNKESKSMADLLKSQAQMMLEMEWEEANKKIENNSLKLENAVFDNTTQVNILETAEKQAKDYKDEDEKKQYKYNYKKKPGRKKKRGPKAGAKKKKLREDKKKEDSNEQE